MSNHKNENKQTTEMLPFHKAADMFPLMAGKEFNALVEDIKLRGLQIPIIVIEEPIRAEDGSISVHNMQHVIIDGRNRYRACLATSVKPYYDVFDGDEKDVIRHPPRRLALLQTKQSRPARRNANWWTRK